jgi:hypothetical protein
LERASVTWWTAMTTSLLAATGHAGQTGCVDPDYPLQLCVPDVPASTFVEIRTVISTGLGSSAPRLKLHTVSGFTGPRSTYE